MKEFLLKAVGVIVLCGLLLVLLKVFAVILILILGCLGLGKDDKPTPINSSNIADYVETYR